MAGVLRGLGWVGSKVGPPIWNGAKSLFSRGGAKAATSGADDVAKAAVSSADDVAAAGANVAKTGGASNLSTTVRNLAIIGATGTALKWGSIYGNNALDGKPLDLAIDGAQALFGREAAEQIFRIGESMQTAQAATLEGGAEHIFKDNDFVTQEDLDDPEIAHLIRAASLYAGGGEISAGMHLFKTGSGSQFLQAYGDVEKRMIEEAGPDGESPNRIDIAREAFLKVRDDLRAERTAALVSSEILEKTPDSIQPNEQASPGSVAGTQMERILKERQEGGGTLNLNQQSPDQIAQVFRSLTGMDTAGIDLTQDTKTWSKSAVSKAFDLAENHGSKLGLGIGFSIVAWGVNALSSAFGQESWLAQGAQKWALDHFEIDDKLLALQNDISSGNYASLGVSEGRFDQALKSLVIDHTPDDPALENS